MIAKAEFTRANMLAFLAKVIRTESWILPRGESFVVDQPAIPNSVPAEWATARLLHPGKVALARCLRPSRLTWPRRWCG